MNDDRHEQSDTKIAALNRIKFQSDDWGTN